VALFLALLLLTASVWAADIGKPPDLSKAAWIWWSKGAFGDGGPMAFFRREFMLSAKPVEATIALTADNGYELYVNGHRVGGKLGWSSWKNVERFRIEPHLNAGANVVAIKAENLAGPAGFIAALYLRLPDGKEMPLATDGQWRSMAKAEANWFDPDLDDSAWKPAVVLGEHGMRPWGALEVPASLTDPRKLVFERTDGTGEATPRADKFSDPSEDFAWPAGVAFVGAKLPASQERRGKWPILGSRAYFEYDTPAPTAMGRKLFALTPVKPDAAPRLLVDAGTGILSSPSGSYDGSEILFAMVPQGEKFFSLFRVAADGSGLQRLTSGPWHDFDPVMLPDGRIVFCSTRIGCRDEYHANTARCLFVLSADRSEIRPFTWHIVFDTDPAVMPDGRVAFVRQDNFMERAKVETHIHCVRPDGTAGEVLIGPDRGRIGYDRASGAEENSRWLRSYGFGCPSPLPDGRIACLSFIGPLIVGPGRGTLDKSRMPSDCDLFDISPLPDGRLLCSTRNGALGLLDPATGKVVKLLATEAKDLHSVCYLGPKPKPRTMPSSVKTEDEYRPDKTGLLFSQCVFQTKQTDGDWGRVRAIRVFVGKPMTLRAARHHYGHVGTEAVELGTAPLAADGSFLVRVPADEPLAIQAVDAEGRPVVSELSWIYVRPGEKRSCTGCHNHRDASPAGHNALAGRAELIDLTAGSQPHRFRANNAANGGVLNMQFDRFREVASIDLYAQPAFPPGFDGTKLPPGRRTEVERLVRLLSEGHPGEKVSAAERLAVFRDRSAAPSLARALSDPQAAVRMAAAMALAACGTRESVPPLRSALRDSSPHVAQAAHIALEHFTGQRPVASSVLSSSSLLSPPSPAGAGLPPRTAAGAGGRAEFADGSQLADAWMQWMQTRNWDALEQELLARVDSPDATVAQLAIEALGHVGGERAKAALQNYLRSGRADSLNARVAAIRALGHLRDTSALPLLAEIIEKKGNLGPISASPKGQLGRAGAPDFLVAAAAEALGWIGTPEAEDALIRAFAKLDNFCDYTKRAGDHKWLEGCHSSPPHYRVAEALDAIGSRKAASLTAALLGSVPIDTDRGLLYENDVYETVISRVIHRSGAAQQVVEACLSVLGDAEAKPVAELTQAVTTSPPAVSVGPLDRESRAAQLLSVVCLRTEDALRVRATLERYRGQAPSAKRSWTCFFLCRTLGRLRDSASVALLRSILDKDPTEASFGIPDPPNVFLHNAMTPCHRATAADALGRIGAKEAAPSLLAALENYENAMDVRHACAHALRRLADSASLAALQRLAATYPEAVTQRALMDACAATAGR